MNDVSALILEEGASGKTGTSTRIPTFTFKPSLTVISS